MQRSFGIAENEEYRRRHQALVQAMKRRGLDLYVVTTTDNIFYLTGATFEPLERPFFLIVGADGSRLFVVPALELVHTAVAAGD